MRRQPMREIDWPRADDPDYLAGLRADGNRLATQARVPSPAGTGRLPAGSTGMTEDALGHLYLAGGTRGVFGDGSLQCGCGARAAKGDEQC